jgi:hypothetical protein
MFSTRATSHLTYTIRYEGFIEENAMAADFENRLLEYSKARLRGEHAPQDLARLLELQWQGAEGGDAKPLDKVPFRLLAVDESHALIDDSHLSESDLANPVTMANDSAIRDVSSFIAYVAVDSDGNVWGYWLGPENVPLATAAIVRFDTEGQFKLMNGAALSEAMIAEYVDEDDDAFKVFAEQFAVHGVNWQAASLDDLKKPNVASLPSKLLGDFYKKHRAAKN